MVSHYPSQPREIAALLAPSIGVPAEYLIMGNGACEVIHAVPTGTPGPVLVSVPTFSAYYEFADGPVITHQLDHRDNFRLDLEALGAAVTKHRPSTVVIINPNNPDGGLIPHADLVAFVERMQGRVDQVIVDESFSHFTTETAPATSPRRPLQPPSPRSSRTYRTSSWSTASARATESPVCGWAMR